MTNGRPMKLKEIRIIISILRTRIGWSFPILILKAKARKKVILSETRWSTIPGSESEFVRRISLAPALYVELGKRIGREGAFEVMEDLLVSIGCNEQWAHLKSMDAAEGAGMARLMAFNERMDQKGTPRFNKREYVIQSEHVCHFVITRCIFHDFFTEVGTPELTKAFCEVDRRFFSEAFPDFRFHRGDSWENTIAYGKENCEFIFEKRAILAGTLH
jgi:hypothetical protein